MGQSASNIQSTLTLAYVIPAEEKQRGREDIQQRPAAVSAARREDVLLSHPEHYALTDTATPSSTSTRRADSGYGEDFHGEKVGQDIAYIDEKYYNPTQKDNSKDYNKKCGNSSRTSLLTFSDVKLDNSLYDINLSARRLIKLSSNISHFATLRRLDLSYNRLSSLPQAIKVLVNLEYLCISHNCFPEIPPCIANLPKLLELDVSHNRVQDLTPCFFFAAEKLQTLKAGSNQLYSISVHVRNMVHLTTLDLSFNNIRVLPIELARLANLRTLQLDGCPLNSTLEYPTMPKLPSLREICARTALHHCYCSSSSAAVKFSSRLPLPDNLARYLSSSSPCSSCHDPYFESYVCRGQWIERADRLVPFEHRLCTAHWSTEDDRILNLFADQISTRDETNRRGLVRTPAKDNNSNNTMTTVPLEQLHTADQEYQYPECSARTLMRSKSKLTGNNRCNGGARSYFHRLRRHKF